MQEPAARMRSSLPRRPIHRDALRPMTAEQAASRMLDRAGLGERIGRTRIHRALVSKSSEEQ